MIISLVSNEGQKCRDIMVGRTIDCKMNLSCQLVLETGGQDVFGQTVNLQLFGD